MEITAHEAAFRSDDVFRSRGKFKILILGLGAIGSNLVLLLARNGFSDITGLDKDRVDNHNPGNQLYTLQDVGRSKAQVLRAKMIRELGAKISVHHMDVEKFPISKARRFDLIVDAFDNAPARETARLFGGADTTAVIHAGMSGDGFGEVKWDSVYSIPVDDGADGPDTCDYPLACNLVHLTVCVLCEVICKFVDDGLMVNAMITLKDLSVELIEVGHRRKP